jgi:hypothetical protein
MYWDAALGSFLIISRLQAVSKGLDFKGLHAHT